MMLWKNKMVTSNELYPKVVYILLCISTAIYSCYILDLILYLAVLVPKKLGAK